MEQYENNIDFLCPTCKGLIPSQTLFTLKSCPQCNKIFSFVNEIPLLVNDIELLTSIIEKAKNADRSHWYEDPHMAQWSGPYRHHMKKRMVLIEKKLSEFNAKNPANLIGLDLGCGDGTNAHCLSKHLKTIYGSDYNILRLVRASKLNLYKKIYLADINNYPVPNNTFDVIFLNHVLEHIHNDMIALSEVFRILKPGGLLILGTPNEGSFFWQLAYRLQPNALKKSDHIHFYTKESLLNKCLKIGFIFKEYHYLGWGVPHWTLDEKIRNYKLADDALELLGKLFFRSQATSMYIFLTKST